MPGPVNFDQAEALSPVLTQISKSLSDLPGGVCKAD